ncbi:MAG: branched-chain amino acid ABC transporter permease [Desulfobacterales bacterium]|nr:branched-chain amino acid ABC transporter permease [Desulfobacterales bacterium]
MVQFIGSSLVLASLYALTALGFVIIYRSSRILNLAHGELFMLGGYFCFVMIPLSGGIVWAGVILAFITSFVVGLILYFLFIRPLMGEPLFSPVMLTIGLSIMLKGIATFVWGSDPRMLSFSLGIPDKPHEIFPGVIFSTYDIALVLTAVIFLGGVLVFLKYSRLGIQMRAAAESHLLASQRGINILVILALTWSIAVVAATASGILYGAGVNITPEIGLVGLKALSVPMVGGMDSIVGIIPAALLVAFAEYGVSRYIGPELSEIIPMVIMLLVLIIRPWGLFGTKEEVDRL